MRAPKAEPPRAVTWLDGGTEMKKTYTVPELELIMLSDVVATSEIGGGENETAPDEW